MADGSVIIDSKLDSSGFEKGLKGLGSIASKGLSATTKAIGAVSTGLVALGGYAAKVGSEFEKSMSQVSATMGYSAQELADTSSEAYKSFELLEATAKKMGSTTQFSATESAEALNYLALAGMDAQKACATLPGVLNLAAAGGMDLATASDQITDAMSSLGIEFDAEGKNVTEFADKISKTAQKSNTSVQQLGEAILTVGGTAKVLAGGTTEMNTALGILADNGIKGAEGGTALRNVILSLTAPTDKAAGALKDLGVSALDSQGNVRPLQDTFRDLDKALSTMSDGEKTQVLNEIFNKVDLKSVNALLTNSSERFDELSGYIDNANGACATMADTMNDNLQGRITELQSATEGLGIQIYESIETPLKEAAEGGIEAVGQLSEALNSGGFSGMAEAIGSLMAQGIAKIAEYAPQVIQASTTVIQSFIQGISDNLPQIIESSGQIVSTFITGIIEVIPQLFSLGGQILEEVANGLIQNMPEMASKASEIIKNVIEGFKENFPQVLSTGIELIQSLADGVSENIPELIPIAIDAILSFVEGIIDNIDTVIDCGIQIIVAIADGIIDSLPTLIEKVPVIINKFWDAFDKALVKIIQAGVQLVVKLGKGIMDSMPTIIANAGQIALAIINTIGHLDMINLGKKLITKLGDGIKAMFKAIKGKADDLIVKFKEPFTTKLTEFKDIGKNIVQGIIDGIKNMISNIGSAIKGVCDSAIKSAKSALGIHSPSKVFKEEVGQYIGQGMAKGIEESTPEVSKATTEMCNNVLTNGKAFLEKQKAQDKAWTQNKKEQYEAQKTALYEYIECKKEANQLSLEDEKYIYNQLLNAAKGNLSEIQEIKKKLVEADEEAYQKRYANSKQFIADKKYFNQLSLQDELAAYERMKDYSKGHKEEVKEIEKEIYRVKKEIKEKEIQDVKDANSKILDELKDRVDKEKAIITGKRDAQLDALQDQLDAMEKAEEERQNNMTIADYETSIQKLQEELAQASNPEEQQRLNEQLFEKQQAYDEWKYQQELKAKKESIRAQMDEVRAQAENQIAIKEDEYEKEKTLLEKQQEAMIQAIQNGQSEMIKSIQEGGAKSLNIQDANAILTMGINKSLTKDKKDNLNQQYEAVIDNEGKCAQAVEDACVEMYRQNYKMGVQMANGIADGILNQTWRAVKAIGMMCDKMIAEAQKKLDIHSPSRVFKKLGEYVDQGFGNGIDNGADGVIGSMTDMCTRLKSAVNIDDLVERMSAAVNGEVAVTSNLLTSGVSSSVTTNTITNNNTSSTPITINNYGVPNADDKFGRIIGSQVNRELRGRGLK